MSQTDEGAVNGGGPMGLPVELMNMIANSGGDLESLLRSLTREHLLSWGVSPKALAHLVDEAGQNGSSVAGGEITTGEDGVTTWNPPPDPRASAPRPRGLAQRAAERQGAPQQGRGPGRVPPGARGPQRQGPPAQRQRQRQAEAEDEAALQALVNETGEVISRSAAALPVAIGLTFQAGGRRVDGATYTWDEHGRRKLVVAKYAPPRRLGMLIEALLVETAARFEAEAEVEAEEEDSGGEGYEDYVDYEDYEEDGDYEDAQG